MKKWETIRGFTMITFATVIVAAAIFFLLMPSHVSMGSMSDLAIVLGNFVPLKISTIAFILNMLLLVLDFLLIGREFRARTAYTLFLLPVVPAIFETAFPGSASIANDAFLDMICYILMVSVGLAMLFNRNASSDGLGIMAKLLNKYPHMELGRTMSMSGMCVTLSAALVYDKKIMVLNVLGTYLSGIALDHFIFGFNIKKRMYIISQREEEIREFILHHLHNGATIYEAIRAYDGQPRRGIITVADKDEYITLMNYVLGADKDAFVTVCTVNEIICRLKH